MIKQNIKILALIALVSTSLSAEDKILYKGYFNSTYDSAKNSIMGGATTATAKGYSAMLSNPAGLSTNYNASVYVRTILSNTSDDKDEEVRSNDPGDHVAVGALYDSFGLEYKQSDHILLGGAYGYESDYGLFSIGLSYLLDQTDLSQKEDNPINRDEFATGDFLTYGLMWQKSFIGLDDYYAVYVGMSHKNSGQYTGDGNPLIIPVSPSRSSYGFGFETNVFSTSILLTLDMSEEYWQSVDETLSGTSFGAKWMISEKLAIGAGMNSQTFSGATLKDIQTVGAGIEFGFLGFQTNTAFTYRTVNSEEGVYLTEPALHLDVAFTF